MQIAVITVAGVSSRFNQGIAEEKKRLKAIFYEDDPKKTLLMHMINRCAFADKIIVVGGYKYNDLLEYIDSYIPKPSRDKITTVYNQHYHDLPTGYSLYCGIDRALKEEHTDLIEGIVFAEGDLDVDDDSFEVIANSSKTVLTYNRDPIHANKAVVLYNNEKGQYRYAFNGDHGLLRIEDAFSSIYNSGQIWRFKDVSLLKAAADKFYRNDLKNGTNLKIIEYYLAEIDPDDIEIVGFDKWVNCNTREDYSNILKGWVCEC